VLLVLISVPAIGLLFFQNRQVQTSISNYLTHKFSDEIEAGVSISSVKYSFFKRLYLYDFLIEDQYGDTLIYSEFTRIRIKNFKPGKLDIHFHSISCENVYFNIKVDNERLNNVKFFTDWLKSDLPPEERVVLKIDRIETINSHFSQTAALVKSPPYGVDFSDMDVYNVNVVIEDFVARMDSVYMNIVQTSGIEKSGFNMVDVAFGLTVGQQFMTFSDGEIITPASKASIPIVDFRFNDYMDFQEVFDSVDTYISSSNSFLAFSDLSYFFYQLEHMNGDIYLNGIVHGKFGDLFGEDIEISYMDSSKLDFDMNLRGMPSDDSLHMVFDIKQFRSDLHTLKTLTSYYDYAIFKDSIITEDIGTFNYSGKFSGYSVDFETDGDLETRLGNIHFDLNMKPDTSRSLQYKGSLKTSDFKIGKLLRQEKYLENVSLNINVDGTNQNGEVDLLVSGMIDSLGLYNYNYRNINLEGNILNKTFDGFFSIKDPNIDMNFTGRVDFEKEIPQMKFTVDVANLRPYYLNLRDDDPEYFASFFLKTDLSGIKLDQLNGEVHLVNSFFKRTGSQVQIYDFMATTQNSDSSFISLKSDILDADIHGNYRLSHLPSTIFSAINNHLEIFPAHEIDVDTSCYFDFNIVIKEANPILEFFFPKFQIAEGSNLHGYYRPSGNSYDLSLTGALPYFNYNGFLLENLELSSKADTNIFVLDLESEKMNTQGDFEIIKPKFSSTALDNRAEFGIQWDNDSLPLYSGDIKAEGLLSSFSSDENLFRLHIDSSWFYYSDSLFVIPESLISFQTNAISLDSLWIYGNNQYILADGSYSPNEEDEIMVELRNIRLDNLSNLSENLVIDIRGRMSGEAIIKNENSKPLFTSDLSIDTLFINDNLIGSTSLTTKWQEQRKELLIDLTSTHDSIRTISINGSLEPGTGVLDFDASLTEIPLSTFNPYLENITNNLSGYLGARVGINGTLNKPEINGNIFLRESAFELNETKTDYNISDNIRIYKNNLFFEEFIVKDKFNNELSVSGNITSSNFQNFIFNLDLDAENFNFLNTSRNDNEQFYGDIFASANVTLRGAFEELDIQASAITEKYTNINLPLYNATEIQTTEFITFRRSEEIEIDSEEEDVGVISGLTLDLDLEIASGANVQLIFDPKVGDIIEASGRGDLKIKIDESGAFTMFGDVLIQDGEYLFTLQNVINKRFRVESGGNIVWSGSPTDAAIDLQAIYELKAAPYNLSQEPDESLSKRIPVHCLLSLTGDLGNPGIKPSIELPTAEPETRTLLENNIGTDEELMRQFISLLVINNFMSAGGNPGEYAPGIGAVGVTASELLSNQLSNLLSQISNDFDIGVNYRPSDQITSDEIEVALSTQLFDDRVIISGNLDVGGNDVNTPNPTNNIVGDFTMEFKVTDKISLKAFNRANDDFILRTAPYTQGVGILYRNEFDEVSDLFKRREKKKTSKEDSVENEKEVFIKEEE
jgi:hypothetical protein